MPGPKQREECFCKGWIRQVFTNLGSLVKGREGRRQNTVQIARDHAGVEKELAANMGIQSLSAAYTWRRCSLV